MNQRFNQWIRPFLLSWLVCGTGLGLNGPFHLPQKDNRPSQIVTMRSNRDSKVFTPANTLFYYTSRKNKVSVEDEAEEQEGDEDSGSDLDEETENKVPDTNSTSLEEPEDIDAEDKVDHAKDEKDSTLRFFLLGDWGKGGNTGKYYSSVPGGADDDLTSISQLDIHDTTALHRHVVPFNESDSMGLTADSNKINKNDKNNNNNNNNNNKMLYQPHVAHAMANLAANSSLAPSFVVALGDNFYVNGVSSATDILWTYLWTDVYLQYASLNIPWYAVLGNHDYGGGESYSYSQVQRSKSAIDHGLWNMPEKNYSRIFKIPNGRGASVAILFVDTTTLAPTMNKCCNEKGGVSQETQKQRIDNQLYHLERMLIELTEQKPTWLLAVGHYPIYSDSSSGNVTELVDYLLPLLRKYRVHAYLCGHDHLSEHLVMHYNNSNNGENIDDSNSNSSNENMDTIEVLNDNNNNNNNNSTDSYDEDDPEVDVNVDKDLVKDKDNSTNEDNGHPDNERTAHTIHFFVAGAGSMTDKISTKSAAQLLWAGEGYAAFAYMDATPSQLTIRYVDINNVERYNYTLVNPLNSDFPIDDNDQTDGKPGPLKESEQEKLESLLQEEEKKFAIAVTVAAVTSAMLLTTVLASVWYCFWWPVYQRRKQENKEKKGEKTLESNKTTTADGTEFEDYDEDNSSNNNIHHNNRSTSTRSYNDKNNGDDDFALVGSSTTTPSSRAQQRKLQVLTYASTDTSINRRSNRYKKLHSASDDYYDISDNDCHRHSSEEEIAAEADVELGNMRRHHRDHSDSTQSSFTTPPNTNSNNHSNTMNTISNNPYYHHRRSHDAFLLATGATAVAIASSQGHHSNHHSTNNNTNSNTNNNSKSNSNTHSRALSTASSASADSHAHSSITESSYTSLPQAKASFSGHTLFGGPLVLPPVHAHTSTSVSQQQKLQESQQYATNNNVDTSNTNHHTAMNSSITTSARQEGSNISMDESDNYSQQGSVIVRALRALQILESLTFSKKPATAVPGKQNSCSFSIASDQDVHTSKSMTPSPGVGIDVPHDVLLETAAPAILSSPPPIRHSHTNSTRSIISGTSSPLQIPLHHHQYTTNLNGTNNNGNNRHGVLGGGKHSDEDAVSDAYSMTPTESIVPISSSSSDTSSIPNIQHHHRYQYNHHNGINSNNANHKNSKNTYNSSLAGLLHVPIHSPGYVSPLHRSIGLNDVATANDNNVLSPQSQGHHRRVKSAAL